MIPLAVMGFGAKLWSFAKSNWQLILIAVVIIGGYIYFQRAKAEAYKKGKADCNAEWNKKIAEEDEANRKQEKVLQDALNKFGKDFEEKNKVRVVKETTHVNNIKEIVKKHTDYSTCEAEPVLLDERNRIRDMGP